METKLTFTFLFALALLQFNADATPGTFDLTRFGAVPGADMSKALTNAWNEAIKSPSPSVIVVPKGTWSLSQVILCGPAKAPVELRVQGIIQAPPDAKSIPDQKAEWITINYMKDFTLTGGGTFDGRGQQAWKQNDCNKNQKCAKLPMNLSFNFINNSVIQDVTTKDSKNFHCNCINCNNVTFQRFTVSAPGDSINTDGIHIARSTKVKVLDSKIATGDDCISIGDEMNDLRIRNVECGPGHGFSIGSMGKNPSEKDVTGIFVQNCKMKNTQNGVRIKTWPSAPASLTISDIHFENITMENVSNPIILDQEYCPSNLCDKSKPSQVKICKVTVKDIKGTSGTPEAVILVCSSAKPCEVEIGNVDLKYNGKLGPITTICTNVKPTFVGKQIPKVCAGPSGKAAGGPSGAPGGRFGGRS